MPDLWCDVDLAVKVPVNILPLLDSTDFKTIETAVVYNSAGLALNWNFVTAAGVMTSTAVTPTDGTGVYDWSEPLADIGMYQIEIPASGGGTINNDTEGVGWFTGVATGVLPWRGPTIGFRRAALNDLFMDGGTASTNMEDFFDGTGYAGGTAKLTVDVDTIKTQAVTCSAPVTVLASVGTAATSTAQTGDSYPLVSTEVAEIYAAVITNAAGADIAADIIAVKADTAAILTDTGTTLDGKADQIIAATITNAAGVDIAADIIAVKADTAAILVDTGTDGVVVASIAADAVNSSALAATAVAEIADGVWDEIITAGQHNIRNSAARILRQASGGTNVTLHSGTAQSGTASTIVLDNAASATDDVYNRNLIALVGGTGTGQTRRIVDYVGSSRTVFVDVNWVVNPNATSQFEVIAAPTSVFADEGVAQGGGNDYIDLATTASETDDIYNNSLVTITGGTGSGQTEVITDYTGATRRASIAAETWGTNPDSTSVYAVIPAGNVAPDTGSVLPAPTASEVADAVWDELKAGHAVADSFGDYLDDEITSRAIAGDAMTLADDAITAAKYDESTAFPLVSADTGVTAVARTGADSDTLETLSDQLDLVALETTAQAILTDTGTTLDGRIPAALVGGRMSSDVGSISADATAADNLEAQYDGTGYINANAPAYQAQISAISGGLAIQELVDSSTVISGSETGTIANMSSDDDVRYVVTADAGTGALEFILKITPADADSFPIETHIHGYYDEAVGATNSCSIQAYDFQSSAWVTLDTMVNAGADQARDLGLVSTYSAPGAATIETVAVVGGDVLIKFIQATNEIGSTVNLDHMTVGFAGSPLTAAEVNAEVDAALADINLDHLVGTATGIPAIPAGTYIDQIMDDGTAVYDRTTDSLQAIRDRGDAAWDTADVSALALQASVDDLEGRLTAARAGYLDNLSAGAVALQASVDDLEGRLTAARAGYLDNLSAGAAALEATAQAIKTKTDNLPAAPAATGDIPTVGQNADAVWDEALAGHAGAGSAGAALTTAGISGDPWSTALPGAYGAGTAGKIMGDNLNATVSSRATQTSVDTIDDFVDTEVASILSAVDTEVAAIKAKTDNLPASPAAVGSQMDLVNAPNATAVTAIQSGLATAASIAALNNLSAAQVNAEVVDALNVDTYAEPGQEAPPATASIVRKLGWLYKAFRNKKTQTAVTRSIFADDGVTVDAKATDSDDGVTFTKGKLGTGP